MTRLLVSFLVLLSVTAASVADAQEKKIVVFAAASMKNALDDVNTAFTKQSGTNVVVSYDASSALMKQIENGAPADVFVSADLKWMDYGSERKLIKDDTRVNLLGNELVLITARDSPIGNITIGPSFDLAKLAGYGRIATGDVRAVPVGIYAQAALEKLGVWPAVERKMAMTGNVRAALVLVARGEAPLGIVYSTDAKVEPNVKIIGVFPEDSPPADHLSGSGNCKCECRHSVVLGLSQVPSSKVNIRGLRFQLYGKARPRHATPLARARSWNPISGANRSAPNISSWTRASWLEPVLIPTPRVTPRKVQKKRWVLDDGFISLCRTTRSVLPERRGRRIDQPRIDRLRRRDAVTVSPARRISRSSS